MTTHKGRPGDDSAESGTGVPSHIEPGQMKQDKRITEKYTEKDRKPESSIQQNNPNRNTDKTDATNAGGYKQ